MKDTGRKTAVVIEDDADIRFLLETTLSQAGFEVHTAATGTAGVAAVRQHDPIVTTLDISLPDIDGFAVARQIREFSSTYLLMLTGRADEIDTLLGLEAGADDYVTKPFRPREVRARIDAMLRRPRHSAAPPDSAAPAPPVATAQPDPSPPEGVHQLAGLTVDLDGRLVDVDGTRVELTRSEFEILAAIVQAARRVLSKAELATRLWPQTYATGMDLLDADRRALEVHVANLRRKLGDDATDPRFIQTVRGVGYRLSPAALR